MKNERTALWHPTEDFIQDSNLKSFLAWLSEQGLHFETYDELWEWSVDQTPQFWEILWSYFDIQFNGQIEEIQSANPMPKTNWFRGAEINYAEHIFRQYSDERPAIIACCEHLPRKEISWSQLQQQVASFAKWLEDHDVRHGDRIVGILPNIPEAIVAFLASCSIGAVWSCCSPDFGADSIVDRFEQIQPKILIAANGYQYNGKLFNKQHEVDQVIKRIDSIEQVVWIKFLDTALHIHADQHTWQSILSDYSLRDIEFTRVPFDHPIWILFSSGTTGIPKAITHGHGGMLLEHLKYMTFHNDVKKRERFFWFTTTGWMMWNFLQSSLLVGATAVLYEGSPAYPSLDRLWQLTEEIGIHHFGTSAPFIMACSKRGVTPGQSFDLSQLRSIGSTGSPLPPEGFDYVYESIKKDVWLCSMSGGTDVCTAFVGGVPTEPVYAGEIQRRCLGVAMYSWDELGEPRINEVGEMVITKSMPCMPIYFWNDPLGERYQASYFDHYPGQVWRHGDWLVITSDNTLVIKGRSDATLNRQGVRIGTAEIYRSLHKIPELLDSLIVNLELDNGQHYMPLFVQMKSADHLTTELREKIKKQLRSDYSPRHVPDEIIIVPDIPYTISGKKLEAPVKRILMGMPIEQAANPGAMKNPDSLLFFTKFRRSHQLLQNNA